MGFTTLTAVTLATENISVDQTAIQTANIGIEFLVSAFIYTTLIVIFGKQLLVNSPMEKERNDIQVFCCVECSCVKFCGPLHATIKIYPNLWYTVITIIIVVIIIILIIFILHHLFADKTRRGRGVV